MLYPSASITKTTTATVLALLTLFGAAPIPAAETNLVHTVPDDGVLFLATARDGRLIWDLSRVPDRENTNLEFPYLIRFKDQWFCSFREGDRHGNDPSGRARVITSRDGEEWETATLIEWEGGDIRDPRMSVTPDGQLMLNSSIYFIGEQKEQPAEWEVPGKRQSVTWLSADGRAWTGPYACPTGFDTWRWDVAWHDGYGYSAGYSGKDRNGTLYRTKDGKQWEVWVENFFDGPGTEAALAFGADGTGYCLLRGGGFYGKFAVSQSPDYREWEWHPMLIDAARNGQPESGATFGRRTHSIVGGQKLLRLRDGRLVTATAKGGTDLFLVNPGSALFIRFARMGDGKSYPGLAEHDGDFWTTNSQRAEGYPSVKSGIYLVRIMIPPPGSIEVEPQVVERDMSVNVSAVAADAAPPTVVEARHFAPNRPVLSFGDHGRTCVRIGNAPQIAALKNDLTVMAWGCPEADETYRTLVDKGGRDAGFSIRQSRTQAGHNHVSARVYAEGEPDPYEPYQVGFTPPAPEAFDARWHHYAFTYDGRMLRLYVDGRIVDACTKTGNMDFSESDLCFGCLATGGEPWKGTIADVAIWARSLTAEEIAVQAQRTLRGDEEGLVGYWPLNEGEGEVAGDRTENANHGTISGGKWELCR